MAVSDSSYESRFTIPAPKGIFQANGDTNLSTNYAYIAENIRTERGLLASAYGTSVAFPSIGSAAGTLLRFTRRNQPDAPELFVACAGGGIYTIAKGDSAWTRRGSGYSSDVWSYVTYEENSVDVLILSNATDGMIALYGDDLRVEAKTLTIGDDYAAVKFATLGRYAERIWGTGADGYPDTIFYSKPYNPFDFTADANIPEMGGGMMQQPTWDGEAFVALQPFGGYLLAIKPSTVFEVRGTDPTNYTITQAYGTDGPMQARSISVDRTTMLFLAGDDIGMYNGQTLSLLARDALYETMRMLGDKAQSLATSCMCNHIYYLALCVNEADGDQIQENNAVIEFDTERSTFMLRNGIRVKDFYALGGEVYYTDAMSPYDVKRYNDEASNGYGDEPIACRWQTAWMDLGKSVEKRDFELWFTAEADADDTPMEITLETEKQTKTKVVLLCDKRKDYHVKMHVRGYRARLTLATGKKQSGWRIYGGVEVKYGFREAD